MNGKEKYKMSNMPYHEMTELMDRHAFQRTQNNNRTIQLGNYVCTNSELHTLLWIQNHPNTTVSEMVQYRGVTQGAISQFTRKLVAKGLVKSEANPNNRRSHLLSVTDDGRTVCNMYIVFGHRDTVALKKDIISVFGEDAFETYLNILKYIVDSKRS